MGAAIGYLPSLKLGLPSVTRGLRRWCPLPVVGKIILLVLVLISSTVRNRCWLLLVFPFIHRAYPDDTSDIPRFYRTGLTPSVFNNYKHVYFPDHTTDDDISVPIEPLKIEQITNRRSRPRWSHRRPLGTLQRKRSLTIKGATHRPIPLPAARSYVPGRGSS